MRIKNTGFIDAFSQSETLVYEWIMENLPENTQHKKPTRKSHFTVLRKSWVERIGVSQCQRL